MAIYSGLAIASLAFLLAGYSGVVPAQTVSVTGPTSVRLGASAQYNAAAGGVTSPAFAWSVNGAGGGAASTGFITASGLFTPASTFPAGHTVTIRASLVSNPASFASLVVKVLNPLPVLSYGSLTPTTQAGTYLVDIQGANFVSGSQLLIAGVDVATTMVSPSELVTTYTLPTGTTTFKVGVLNPNAAQSTPVTQTLTAPAIPQATLTQAARLLDQTSFGPTLPTISQVQQIGMMAYLNQQFALPATLMPAIPLPPVPLCPDATYRCVQNYFWQSALTANDQLRQRVAFALSEMFVVSTDEVNARSIPAYHNLLVNDAFANFSQIMNDIATSPAMGAYLNMLNSAAAPAGQIANENFARELMQLFTTGLVLLNGDGTPQLDAQGQTQPVFTEAQVQAYARALTGWTYAAQTGGPQSIFPNGVPNFNQPMQAVESFHDMSSKALLSGVTLPAGQTAEADLAGVIASIFNHPNVGPFVCRQIIQHLVASSPSPGYVSRVAAVFANDGNGVRGNMKAVVTAIVTDPEARAADSDASVDGGHLREPILYFTGILRGLGFTNVNSQGRYDVASSYTGPLGQVPYAAASVFNFFPPNYVIPTTALNAPEFALENTSAAMQRLNLADSIVRNHLTSFSIDMSPASELGEVASSTGNPAVDSANLVNALNILFTHNQMPVVMQTSIAAQLASIPDIGQRVRVATYLVISSDYYAMEH
jgi:uncharacterized protein (DUF1800 family)